uniref:Uncharacterized protein n=1 Tax=Arundo donax TaxID=35708 RepID=A0A0A9FK94_ARUDO
MHVPTFRLSWRTARLS